MENWISWGSPTVAMKCEEPMRANKPRDLRNHGELKPTNLRNREKTTSQFHFHIQNHLMTWCQTGFHLSNLHLRHLRRHLVIRNDFQKLFRGKIALISGSGGSALVHPFAFHLSVPCLPTNFQVSTCTCKFNWTR